MHYPTKETGTLDACIGNKINDYEEEGKKGGEERVQSG